MKRLLIYIASPYRIGSQAANVRTQLDAAHQIMDFGHVPYAPLLNHYLDIHRGGRTPEQWVEDCLVVVPRCDAMIRLLGESDGADREEELALALDLPIFYAFTELRDWLQRIDLHLG